MKMSAVILAGGKSSRMGQDKAFLKIGNRTIVEYQLQRLNPLFEELLLSTNLPEKFAHLGLETVQDFIPDRGPLVGIYSSLLKARYSHLFAIACDMPFISPGLITYMKEDCKDYDVTVPETERGLEPLHAIYSKTCLPAMKEYVGKKDGKEPALSGAKGRVIEFFPQVKVRVVTKEEISRIPGGNEAFLNFNTMEEYRKQVDRKQ
ncbi:MAG: molybdenum cofactor guanylyltransferase [Planctomycetota bacterium]|mgnify:CR=1 FL=1